MTVTDLKDGRIEVEKPRDALLLSLAGVKLVNKWGLEEWRFDGKEWGVFNEFLNTFNPSRLNTILYVPADVAKEMIKLHQGQPHWKDCTSTGIRGVYMRRHNDRWNLLPDIEMEK
jgi:hypothetical protein